MLPVAAAGLKVAIDENTYKGLENYFDFGKEVIDAALVASEKVTNWVGEGTSTDLEHGRGMNAHGAMLREFHALLKSLDPSSHFGGLVKVRNKREEFLWVHPRFKAEY